MGTIKNARRKTKWDKTQADLQGSRDYSKHLLERITVIENAINWMLKPKCPCGSREVENRIAGSRGDYVFGEIRCFYCHRLLEAYGIGELKSIPDDLHKQLLEKSLMDYNSIWEKLS